MKTLIEEVVDRLCKYMGEKGISQYKLAQLSCVPFSTIRSIMQRRTKNIQLKTIIMLASGLDVPLNEFLDDNIFNINNLDLE